MNRFLPYPFLTGSIVFMWLSLSGFTLGQLLVGIIVALFCGWIMQRLEPEKIIIKNWSAVFVLAFRVFIDSISSHVSVAYCTLKKKKEYQSGFVVIPLLLENRTALAVLACIFSLTPGSIWVAYNKKNKELLIHVLNLTNENDYKQLIKQRYEALLLEIFA
ncbi:Na+/H+ antiporter subunit E [Bartonella sp. F02]|uniref:Na+/H+ antiporter subunit E n=1 Tax=Bartonella sp. F02 TaxID=2967262 RepID=UPI0022A9344D|nr:Na+/H+ antiporter subunit E [Bartonella sp. F02]MCZ2327903.1 Na+/H+ antiporter subunit E [Bartonella sp. F02]